MKISTAQWNIGGGKIYDGTFSGKVFVGWGITAELLRKNGINVISEEEV